MTRKALERLAVQKLRVNSELLLAAQKLARPIYGRNPVYSYSAEQVVTDLFDWVARCCPSRSRYDRF